MTPLHKPADYVRPRVTDARVERQWAAIEAAGLPGAVPARRRGAAVIALALAAGAAAAAAVVMYLRAPSLPAGALLESAQTEIAVQLEDGSRVELTARTQLRLLENRPGGVALELRSGTARFQVKHDRARRFAIKAGPAEVRVIGTRFELTRKAQAGGTLVRVSVTEGVVEVRRHDLAGAPPHRIGAGESWSAAIPNRAGLPNAPSAPNTAMKQPAAAATRAPIAAPEPAPGPAPVKSPANANEAPAAAPAEQDRGPGALFLRANLARRAGRMRDAADGYVELLSRHPGDARAGLSAFELGRIRMDALDDADGAIAALEQALRARGTASFHEDALARIVIASDALGRTEDCRRARERYRARYPHGVHAHALQARCR